MVELGFERRLERLFGESPELSDAESFVEHVQRRLDAGWTARRWLIGTAGVIGGVICASQLMVSNVLQRVETVGASARLFSSSFSGLNHFSFGSDWVATISSGGGAVWVAAGLAVVMMGYVLTRVIGEI